MRPHREPMTVVPCPNVRFLPGAPRWAPLTNCCCHWRAERLVPIAGAHSGPAVWRTGCESADKNSIIKEAGLPIAVRTSVLGTELR